MSVRPSSLIGEIDARTYGAKGDGSTDDTAALILAAAAAATAGLPLRLARGTYYVPAGLSLSVAVPAILGDGASLELDANAASGSVVLTLGSAAAGCLVSGLTVDGNGATNATGIRPGGNRQTVRGCTLVNCPAGGVYIAGAQTDLDISHNTFTGGGYGVLFADASTASRVLIDGNRFLGGASGDAIEVNTPTTGASDITITNNLISGYANTSASGIGIGLAKVTGAIVANNTITDCGNDGIHVENDSPYVVIEGNRVANCERSGISIQAGLGVVTPKHGTIRGNIVTGCLTGAGQGAIALEGATPVEYWIVEGNVVRGNGRADATCYGIDLGATGVGHTVTDNKVSNTTGNNTAGIRWNALADSTITHNTCWDDQDPKTQQYGIRAYGVNTDVVLMGNSLDGNLSGTIDEAVISAGSTGYVKRYNRPAGIDNGAQTAVVAGAIDDTSFGGVVVPLNGTFGIDSSNGRIYFKYGNAWHYVAQTA